MSAPAGDFASGDFGSIVVFIFSLYISSASLIL